MKAALADDFNTPAAVDAIMDLIHHGNRQLKARTKVCPKAWLLGWGLGMVGSLTLLPPKSCFSLHGATPPEQGGPTHGQVFAHVGSTSSSCLLRGTQWKLCVGPLTSQRPIC